MTKDLPRSLVLLVSIVIIISLGLFAAWLLRMMDREASGPLIELTRGGAATIAGGASVPPSMEPVQSADPFTTVVGDLTSPAAALRIEGRDATWAGPTEAALQRRIASFSFIDGSAEITCAVSVCVISGSTQANTTEDVKLMWQELQQFSESETLPAGLISTAASYGQPGAPYRFTLYFRRDDASTAAR